MAYDIRPLSFSEILDRAFRVYRDHFALLFGICAIILIPIRTLDSPRVVGNQVTLIVNLIFLLAGEPVMDAALTIPIASVYLGRSTSIRDAYKSVLPIVLPFIGTFLLFFALIFGMLLLWIALIFAMVMAVAFSPMRLSLIEVRTIAEVVLVGGFFVISGYFIMPWALFEPVSVVERRFRMASLRRSRDLVGGSWWRTLGIVLTAFFIVAIPLVSLRFVWGFVPGLGVVLTAATEAIVAVYSRIVVLVYYFDRRCRKEDFDLRLLAEQIRAQSVIPTAAAFNLPR